LQEGRTDAAESQKNGQQIMNDTKDRTIYAAIFDLDGVLVDTAVFHFQAWSRLANELGFEIGQEENERMKGVSRMAALDILLEIGGIDADEQQKAGWAARKNGWYVELISQMKEEDLLPGVRRLLNLLRAKGIRIALASASKNAPAILRFTGLEGAFESVVDGNRTHRAKPDPEVFLTAAADLGVDPAHCVVFEDAAAGVQGALAGGMLAIGVGSPENLGEAHLVIPSIADFDPGSLNFQTASTEISL
jgi:beta-phosphoglucomutase